MGNIAYVLCLKSNNFDNDLDIIKNKTLLLEFTKSNLMHNKNDQDIFNILEKIAEGVEEIRNDYRNPCAHTNQLKRTNAQECFDLVLDIEKLLKFILDSFDH